MKISFRLKIALISFVTSGALLAAFGLMFFVFSFQSGIDRMDREIRTLAESTIHSVRPPDHWQNFDRSLQFIYGQEGMSQVALSVKSNEGDVLFKSENTPAELELISIPEGERTNGREREQAASHFIQRLDLDGDKLISQLEFDGPPHVFEQMDSDKDQFISVEEAKAGKAPLQADPRGGDEGLRYLQSAEKTLESSTGKWRAGVFREGGVTLAIAMDMNLFYADINTLLVKFLVGIPIGLLLLAAVGWFLAARAMQPVAVIADTAEGITAKGLDRRIPAVGTDVELERLVTVTNKMLDRLEKSYHQAVRFSSDAAHELQTPLTILQGELDNAIQSSDIGSEEQQRCSMLLAELSNLKSVVKKLLLLAHADEGRLNLSLQPVDLSDLVHTAVEDIEVMAPGLTIEQHIAEGLMVPADSALLNQVIRNMTSNAAKYTTAKGRVIFSLKSKENSICFTLSNTSDPIPEADMPLLFKRFHRVEKSRTSSGSGLGLSLAREIARAHGGELSFQQEPSGMVSFVLQLPKAAEPQPNGFYANSS